MIVHCNTCNFVYEVVGPPGSVSGLLASPHGELPLSFKCITPLCSGRLLRVKNATLSGHTDLVTVAVPLERFFRGINGFGAGEAPARPQDVKTALMTQSVAEVHVREIGQPTRTIIDRIVLDDGTRLHFASSSQGACVYYLERRGPSCLEVFDVGHAGEGCGCRDDAGYAAHREEDRRAHQDSDEGGPPERNSGGEAELPDADLPAVQAEAGVQASVPGPEHSDSDQGLRMQDPVGGKDV